MIDAKDLTKPGEALGGIRQLLQDVIAPEVQGMKATLTALHEGQQQLREEMKAQEGRLTSLIESKAKETGLIWEEMKAQEGRLTNVIEAKAKETILTIQLAESERRNAEAERRSAEAERRNAELVRRLEEGTTAQAKQ